MDGISVLKAIVSRFGLEIQMHQGACKSFQRGRPFCVNHKRFIFSIVVCYRRLE